MPTILTLNHQDYLVPDAVNINTLLKALEGVKTVRVHYRSDRDGGYSYTVESAPALEIKIVRKDQIRDPKKAKQIPEKASADCNGPMV